MGIRSLIIMAMTSLVLTACQEAPVDTESMYRMYGSEEQDPGDLISKVSQAKVYFGHQSVGNNILEGVRMWEEEEGVVIGNVESRDFLSVSEIPWVHFRVGSNADPKSKVDDFADLLSQVSHHDTAIAFFKFCYDL